MTYRELRTILNTELTNDMLDTDISIGIISKPDDIEYFSMSEFIKDCMAEKDPDAPFDEKYPQPVFYFEA
jgi:hypothetical protein